MTDRPLDPLRWRALALLFLVYTFNFVDRQIVGILAVPIKVELGLSDTELGLMGGLAFALFYTALGIPVAALADAKGRTRVITVALALWSLFTAACGFAANFWQLFLARLGVGVGEAGGTAPSYALIGDYFPPAQRARALAAFSFGIPVGSALGIFFGGWVASTVDWRAAFIAVGLAGLLLAPLFRRFVPEPPRGRYDPPAAGTSGFTPTFRRLLGKPAFWFLSFGAAASSMMGYGLLFWLPSYFGRSYDLALIEVARVYGSIVLIGGLAGIWLGGALADRLGAGGNRRAYALVPALAFFAAVPLYAAALAAGSVEFAFILFLLPQALSLVWLGPVITAIQALVPPAMRSVASACFLFVNNLVGLGLGTVFLGVLSDLLAASYGEAALGRSILYGLTLYVLAGALMLAAALRLPRDWHG